MERKKVLILGASLMQTPAIKAAREMGWFVIVADRDSAALGISLADRFEQVDLADREGMLDTARRCRDSVGLDGVFTTGTDFSTTVAWVAENLGLPGISYEVAQNASDKGRMREIFHNHNVPAPRFETLTVDSDPVEVTNNLSLPLVVKPVDSMGARGVVKINRREELPPAVGEAIGHSRSSRAIVEEFVEGPEFSLDALVYKGEIFLCGIADRHIYFPPYFVEMGHTMPSSAPEPEQRAVIDAFYLGIRALGIDNGAAKGDVKFSRGRAVVGEIAARLSGGYMSGWTYPYASGVNLTAAALRIAVGEPPGELSPKRMTVSAERAFLSIPGRVNDVVGLDGARNTKAVRELFLRVEAGSKVQFPTNNLQKSGNVITQANTRNRAVAVAEEAARSVLVRLEAGNEETASFLFGPPEIWIPDAFPLEDISNRAAMESMPGYFGFTDTPASGLDDKIGIEPLPQWEKETALDWLGRTFSSGLAHVLDLTHLSLSAGRTNRLGSLFWRAFIRGGVQGGLWLADTAKMILEEGGKHKLRELLSLWL